MVITDKAWKEISRQDAGRGRWVRIFVMGGGCQGFKYGVTWMEPMRMMSNSAHLLEPCPPLECAFVYIDEKSYRFLENATFDFAPFKGFTFDNPKATSSCGCGESVSF